MEKKSFFTQEFYENPSLTLEILNKLVDRDDLVADMDMYKTGKFLFMEVYENDETKALLSDVISDFEAYKKYNAERFATDEIT